jgi:hypothetical protein
VGHSRINANLFLEKILRNLSLICRVVNRKYSIRMRELIFWVSLNGPPTRTQLVSRRLLKELWLLRRAGRVGYEAFGFAHKLLSSPVGRWFAIFYESLRRALWRFSSVLPYGLACSSKAINRDSRSRSKPAHPKVKMRAASRCCDARPAAPCRSA